MDKFQSPLRYPGGKNALADYFEIVLKENLLIGSHLYEPYAGGASISLAMLSREVVAKATLVEKDPLIYAFWKCVRFESDELCERIMRLSITVATWKKLQKYLDPRAAQVYPLIELAVAGLFFNRSNFSGILEAGPIGGMQQVSEYKIDCRFNKERIIGQIETLATLGPRLSVVYGDALQYLRRVDERIVAERGVAYLDPPYLLQGHRLYRYSYERTQHQAVANLVANAKYSWIVSYDNHPYVRRLFSGQRIVPISLNYAVKESRKADELLISNIRLNKPIYLESARREIVSRKLAVG
jgi:DNA adenine methylase